MSVVDDVKTRLDIVELVGGYVRLQKAGRYFKANCPFHTERTPSFYVYPDRQSWHCFGACSTGGDVISFFAKKENLDFAGALRQLAERAGVELHNDGPRRQEAKTLLDANEAAAIYFQGLLQNASGALAYAEQRGLDRETLSAFQIGYAPAGWEGLKSHLRSRGFDEARLIEAGLLIEGERGGYDRFRDRLMFPIRDERGRVVGFGGRVLSGTDSGPKYMNTPQTPIFDKGGILYGLDRAKDAIRRDATAVIVEGYMDVIAAHQHGFANVVASMGTALTDRQALLVQRFAGHVVLAMDADEAGSAANLRAIQVVAAAATRPTAPAAGRPETPKHFDIRVLALPRGKDPDELIRADASAWAEAVKTAKPVVEHLFAVTTAGKDLSQPQVRADIANEVLPAIGEIVNPVEQAHYLQQLNRITRLGEDALRRQLPRRARPARSNAALFAAATAASAVVALRREPKEEFCLALLYAFEDLVEQGAALPDDLFSRSENRELFRRWRCAEPPQEDDAVWEHYQAVRQTRLPVTETARAAAALLDCVSRLQHARMRSVKEASALALAEGEAGVRPGQVAAIAEAKMAVGIPGESEEADAAANEAVSLLLADHENSQQLFAGVIERSRSGQITKRSPTEGRE